MIDGEKPILRHKWVPIEKISKHLPMAVIASEDNRFPTHNGFDMVEIKKAMKENETRRKKRGASTISQQTARMFSYGRVPHGLEKDLKSTLQRS